VRAVAAAIVALLVMPLVPAPAQGPTDPVPTGRDRAELPLAPLYPDMTRPKSARRIVIGQMARFARLATPPERNAETVTALYKAWNWGMVGTLLDLLHPEVEWSDGELPGARLLSGIDEVEREIRSRMGVLDVSYHLRQVTQLEGRALAEGLSTRGKGFPNPFIHLFDLQGGLIARRRTFATRADALDAAAYTQLAG
jgi:ketosteroid isomerase-like protein